MIHRPRRREVLVTAPFRRAFADLARHYEALRSVFPDSGARLGAFSTDLFDRIVPLLERDADIGRPYLLRKLDSPVETGVLTELLPELAGQGAVAREWIEREFSILYLVTSTRVLLVNLKHHRQSGY